jgi:hypothetical protein
MVGIHIVSNREPSCRYINASLGSSSCIHFSCPQQFQDAWVIAFRFSLAHQVHPQLGFLDGHQNESPTALGVRWFLGLSLDRDTFLHRPRALPSAKIFRRSHDAASSDARSWLSARPSLPYTRHTDI